MWHIFQMFIQLMKLLKAQKWILLWVASWIRQNWSVGVSNTSKKKIMKPTQPGLILIRLGLSYSAWLKNSCPMDLDGVEKILKFKESKSLPPTQKQTAYWPMKVLAIKWPYNILKNWSGAFMKNVFETFLIILNFFGSILRLIQFEFRLLICS